MLLSFSVKPATRNESELNRAEEGLERERGREIVMASVSLYSICICCELDVCVCLFVVSITTTDVKK